MGGHCNLVDVWPGGNQENVLKERIQSQNQRYIAADKLCRKEINHY